MPNSLKIRQSMDWPKLFGQSLIATEVLCYAHKHSCQIDEDQIRTVKVYSGKLWIFQGQ